jgi:hypothetical protein
MNMQVNPQSAPIHIKQTPQPVYTPPPFYPPPFGYSFEPRTLKGLKYINWGLWINAIAMLVILVGFAFMSGFHFPFLLFVLIGEVLVLVFFILALIGLVQMHLGRFEFGPLHAARVAKALIFIAVAIVISFVGGFSSIFFLFGRGGFNNGFGGHWAMFQLIQLVFGFASNLFISLMWVYLIIELSHIKIRNLLWVYFGLSMALYAVATIFFFSWRFLLDSSTTFVGSLGVIASFILIYCYWKTYNRVLTGEIKPIPLPMMQPPYFPPGQPPYYPPQAPPSYPPQYLKDPYRK